MKIFGVEINIKNNAKETEKDFENLNDTLDETAKANDEVNESFDTGATFAKRYGDELQPLTTRMGEAEDRLYELAIAGDTTSKEYQELLTKVGEYRKVQIQTDLAVDQAAQTMSQKLGGALGGATSGFAAVQGVMALTGGESKALEESLLKVQAAMAIQQGIAGIQDYSKSVGLASKATRLWSIAVGGTTGAMKLLRLALISTGIGALVVVLGTLIANQDKVSKGTESVTKSFEEMPFVLKLLLHQLNSVVEAYKTVMKAAEFLGLAETKQEKQAKARHQEKMKRYLDEQKALSQQREDILHTLRVRQKALDDEIEMLEAQGKKTTDIQRQKLLNEIEVSEQMAEVQRKSLALAIQNDSFLIDAQQSLYDGRLAIIKENERKLAVFDAKINTEKLNNYKQYLSDKTEADKQRSEELQQLLDDEIDAEIQLLAELDKIKRANEDALRTDEENELLRVEEKYDVLEAMAFGNAEALNEIEIARLNARNEIFLKFDNEAYNAQKALDDKAAADRKARDEKEEANAKALAQYKIDVATKSLTAINDIAELFSKGSEKQAKRAFNIQKAVGIAQATINTAQAITKVFAETTDFTPTQSLRIANAVAIGVAGAAQVASIASQTFEGGGGGETPSVDASGGEAQAPSFNVVGDSGINQLAQLQQAPVQAFVVSGEVTTSQALDRNRVENATL